LKRLSPFPVNPLTGKLKNDRIPKQRAQLAQPANQLTTFKK
jgi:hypothetical protein